MEGQNRHVRPDTLVDKLHDTLSGILGQTPLGEDNLSVHFSPRLESSDGDWSLVIDSEAHAIQLLTIGVNNALKQCANKYDPRLLVAFKSENRVGSSLSRVDKAVSINGINQILQEGKSPTVMEYLRNRLPLNGIKLIWQQGGPVLLRVFLKAAVYLGLQHLEWLFLTCHNSWIIFRLTEIGDERVLAYSDMIDISNSSAHFCAYFGALLSVVKQVAVSPTVFPNNLILDTLPEEEEWEDPADPPSDDDHGDKSGNHEPSESGDSFRDAPMTNDCLMLTTSSICTTHPHWIRLCKTHPIEVPSLPWRWGRFIRLTKLLGYGSTGGVYQGFMEKVPLAVKIVEILRPDDELKRQRLQTESHIYLHLERLLGSSKLPQRIAPQFYGSYKSKRLEVLFMDLHGSSLIGWDELGSSEKVQIFSLVKRLHLAGVKHGDLEPRNVVRASCGGFVLVDFAASLPHACPDNGRFDALVLLKTRNLGVPKYVTFNEHFARRSPRLPL